MHHKIKKPTHKHWDEKHEWEWRVWRVWKKYPQIRKPIQRQKSYHQQEQYQPRKWGPSPYWLQHLSWTQQFPSENTQGKRQSPWVVFTLIIKISANAHDNNQQDGIWREIKKRGDHEGTYDDRFRDQNKSCKSTVAKEGYLMFDIFYCNMVLNFEDGGLFGVGMKLAINSESIKYDINIKLSI